MCKQIQKGLSRSQKIYVEQQQNVVNAQVQPLLQQQPGGNAQAPRQVHPAAPAAVMNQQQRNARNKKERRRARKQEEARQQYIQQEIQKGMDFLEAEEIQAGTAFMEAEEREEAARHTMAEQVVTNTTPEQIKQYGCASRQQTVSLEEARRAAEESGGFLYYEKITPGLAVLKPTLPETVTVRGQKVLLRRTYNLLIREIARNLVDEAGQLRPDASSYMKKVNYLLELPFRREKEEDLIEELKENVDLGDNSAMSAIVKISRQCGFSFLPGEILGDVENMIKRVRALGDMSPQGMQNRLHRIEQAMLRQNGGAPLTPEQQRELDSIPELYQDARRALQELASLRNLNPDDPDVPLPNACSANAIFQQMLRPLSNKPEKERIRYEVSSHVEAACAEHIQFILDHMDWIAQQRGYSDEDKTDHLRKVRQLKRKLEAGGKPSQEEIDMVSGITVVGDTAPSKYAYHYAGVVGTIDGEEEPTVYTVETFAAESKEYMVSPFTRRAAVGRYRGREGFIAYYNQDNPLPSEEDRVLSVLKVRMASGTLPGDPPQQ